MCKNSFPWNWDKTFPIISGFFEKERRDVIFEIEKLLRNQNNYTVRGFEKENLIEFLEVNLREILDY